MREQAPNEGHRTLKGRASTESIQRTIQWKAPEIQLYAIGAGITAAAGTRLALQLILVKGFKLFSFQLPNQRLSIVISCHYLPVTGLGNLRACCLPWMW
jgi:hypothetical protein